MEDVSKDEYALKNTMILTPELVRSYLGLEVSERISKDLDNLKSNISKLLEFLLSNPTESEFIDYFTKNIHLLDVFIVLGLSSYELLARLLLLLEFKFKENKIKDEKLNRIIAEFKGSKNRKIPNTSIDLKTKIRQFEEIRVLCAFLLYKMFSQSFSIYYAKNIDNGDEHEFISESIRINYDLPFSKLRKILEILKENEKLLVPISDLLADIYLSEVRGTEKAREGYSYEAILKEVLDKNRIPNEVIGKKPKGTRDWDIYIPTKSNPSIVIEVMYTLTTSSGMTNKIKAIVEESKKQKFKIFVLMDGIGWIARWSDARKLFKEDIYVFTFHKESLEKAIKLIKSSVKQNL
jgi:hypothetical protein